ncbi:transposase [Saccharopolyspora sp. NPDC000995]
MIVAEFIASQRTTYGIPHAIACRALGVSQSWFYKWINRTSTKREQRPARLDEQISRISPLPRHRRHETFPSNPPRHATNISFATSL